MSCREWEEKIALFEGGDLAAGEAAEVERHLAECSGCREAAEAVGWSLDLIRQAGHEPIAPAHFAAVRARVLAELEAEPRPAWRRAWVWGLAGAVVLLGVLVMPRPAGRTTGRSAPSALVARQASLPALSQPADQPKVYGPATPGRTAVNRRAAVPRRHAVSAQARTEEEGTPGGPPHQVLIKLLTDDPDVIIYWIADVEGD